MRGSPSACTPFGCLSQPGHCPAQTYLPEPAFRGMEERPAFLFKGKKRGGAGMKASVPLRLFHLPGRGRTGQEMRSWGEGACVCWILGEGLGPWGPPGRCLCILGNSC